MPSSNKSLASMQKQSENLDILISKAEHFLSRPTPKVLKVCKKMADEGRLWDSELHRHLPEAIGACDRMADEAYLLWAELERHFRFYFDAPPGKEGLNVRGIGEGKIIPECGEFISEEAKQATYYQKKKLIELTHRVRIRYDEAYEHSLPWQYAKVIKPYNEPPKKPFRKEWKDSLIYMRQFLKEKRVKEILMEFKSDTLFEIPRPDNPSQKMTVKFAVHDNRVFVIYLIEPLVLFGTSLMMKTPETKYKEKLGRIIVLLAIHFKKCLGDEHYAWMANLLSTCIGKKLTEGSVKERIYRFRKKESEKYKVWWSNDYYYHHLGLCKMAAKDSGLSQLVRKMVK